MLMNFNEIEQKDKEYIASTYNRFPVAIASGKGSVFYSVDGKEYIGRKWLSAGVRCPAVGESVTVSYREDKPSKFSIGTGKAL